MNLYQEWMDAKEVERLAIEGRRKIEDQLTELLGISEQLEGSQKTEIDGYKITVIGRMTRKVDVEAVEKIGMPDISEKLFRWSAEVNLTAWKQADKEVTKLFENCITTKPARPSYKIEIGE